MMNRMIGRKNGALAGLMLSGVVLASILGACSSSQPEPKDKPQIERAGTPLVAPSRGRQSVETGGVVEIRKSWVAIRAEPSLNAKSMGLAYGNDTFTVVNVEGDWVQIQVKGNRNGWIPMEATQD